LEAGDLPDDTVSSAMAKAHMLEERDDAAPFEEPEAKAAVRKSLL
jgi:hypothetical protein